MNLVAPEALKNYTPFFVQNSKVSCVAFMLCIFVRYCIAVVCVNILLEHAMQLSLIFRCLNISVNLSLFSVN